MGFSDWSVCAGFVLLQAQGSDYDFEANLTLMKLYVQSFLLPLPDHPLVSFPDHPLLPLPDHSLVSQKWKRGCGQ